MPMLDLVLTTTGTAAPSRFAAGGPGPTSDFPRPSGCSSPPDDHAEERVENR